LDSIALLPRYRSIPWHSSAIENQTESNRSQADLATKGIEEFHVSTTLLPITQLELKAQLLFTRSTPQKRLVGSVGGRLVGENGGADKLAFDGWLVPAVLVDEAKVVRIVSGRVGDEPDVRLCTAAAGNGAGIVLCRKLGDVDLQHAASGSRRDEGEGNNGLDGVGVGPSVAVESDCLPVDVAIGHCLVEIAYVGSTKRSACSRNKLSGRGHCGGKCENRDKQEDTAVE
jgi:hypothetical protein